MRNKLFILVSIIALLLAIVVLFLVMFFSGRTTTPATEESNPFGNTSTERPIASSTLGEYPLTSTDTDWIRPTGNTPATDVPMLRMLSKDPVSSAVPYTQGVSTTTNGTAYVRYVLRTSGSILETPLAIATPPVTLSQKTILRVGRSLWVRSGTSVLMQYLDESNEDLFSYLGNFTAPSASSTEKMPEVFTGRPLPNNIITATFSPDGASVFYLTPSEKGAEGYIESITSGTRALVYSTPFRSMTAVWGNAGTIVLYNNPSQDASGAVWILDPKTWKAKVVLSDQYALSARISPSGTKLLYSMMEGGQNSTIFSLRVLDLKTNNVIYLPLPTLSEKCVWGHTDEQGVYCAVPKNNLRTDDFMARWYMGQLTYEDVLWHFNTDTGAGKQIIDPSEEVDAPFDIIDLAIDPTNTFVTFRTKQKEMLWAVRLPQATVATSTADTNI